MTKPRFVCLGDIIALPVHSTPLLGPLLTKPGPKASSQNPAEDPEKSHYIVFLRVVELTCKSRDDSNGVRRTTLTLVFMICVALYLLYTFLVRLSIS